MNTVKITQNQDEHSVTVTRSDSTKIDFVSMKDEIIVGQTNPADDSHTQIVLTTEEAKALQAHLATVLHI